MIDPNLLNDLCCPKTHQPLARADSALIEKLNAQIESGQLRNRAGEALREKLEGGLRCQEGNFLYPIRNGLPILLIDEAIVLS